MKSSDTRTALETVVTIPQDSEGPVFSAPWEAEVFAITLSLHEQGLFVWKEWAAMLSEEIARAQAEGDPDLGDTYYQHWLAALERMIVEKNVGDKHQLSSLYDAWDTAAKTTPHGEPIKLDGIR